MCSVKVIPIQSYTLEPVSFDVAEGTVLPLYATYITAGFPSPADDHLEDRIDLSSYLVQNPTATYMMRVKGTSMVDANIHEDDILVIDKSLPPAEGLPVVCFLDGEFTVKTFRMIDKKAFLMPANPNFKPIEVTEDMDMRVWGVVVWVLHKPRKQ